MFTIFFLLYAFFDTIGNEWLTTLMKYFSYHFMDPRNQQKEEDRDIFGGQPREGGVDNKSVSHGLVGSGNPPKPGTGFDSNIAGYNLNNSSQFFERIDYVLYHGNKGVQYSIINPMMAEFKPGNIDYSSSEVQEFTMTFDYERFTVYNKLNFDLETEDIDRFEELGAITGDLFEEGKKPLILETGRTLDVLGTEEKPRARSNQTVISTPTGEGGDDNANANIAEPVDVYGVSYDANAMTTMAGGTETKEGSTVFTNILGDVADSALNAVLRGQNVKDAIVSTAVHRASTALGSAIAGEPETANSISNTDAIDSSSTNQANTGGN